MNNKWKMEEFPGYGGGSSATCKSYPQTEKRRTYMEYGIYRFGEQNIKKSIEVKKQIETY